MHTNFGAITLLLQEQSPGLEVLDPRTAEWKLVPPSPAECVVNTGNMLIFRTNEYRTSMHCIINREPGDRYSTAFFLDGMVMQSCPLDRWEKDNPLTIEQHMICMAAESYSTK